MNRKIVVLVLGGGKFGRSGTAASLDAVPVLGRPAAGYVLTAAASLKPEAVFHVLPDKESPSATALVEWAAAQKKKIPLQLLCPASGRKSRGELILPALLAVRPHVGKDARSDILLVSSSQLLLGSRTLRSLLAAHRRRRCSLTLLGAVGADRVSETAVLRAEDLFSLTHGLLSREKEKGGYDLLTQVLVSRGKRVGIYEASRPEETRSWVGEADLSLASGVLRSRKIDALIRRGVRFLDPQTAWIDVDSELGPGTVLYPSVYIEGSTRIGRDCRIYPHVHISGSRIGDGVRILDCTVIDGSVMEKGAQVGPFSRLRPGTILRPGSKVGNFVEMKNTDFGSGSKAQHLSYLGDSLVGEKVNVGAGTITCNYDGVRKSRTHIESGVFIGSGTELVAPVKVGKGAYVAAGSTITRDVGPGSLAISRGRQEEKPGWVLKKIRDRKKARKP